MVGADAEKATGGGEPAEPAGEIADDGDADHHDRRGQNPRDDQEADRTDGLGLEGLDFLGDHHGAEFRGDAGSGEARQHDGARPAAPARGRRRWQ